MTGTKNEMKSLRVMRENVRLKINKNGTQKMCYIHMITKPFKPPYDWALNRREASNMDKKGVMEENYGWGESKKWKEIMCR